MKKMCLWLLVLLCALLMTSCKDSNPTAPEGSSLDLENLNFAGDYDQVLVLLANTDAGETGSAAYVISNSTAEEFAGTLEINGVEETCDGWDDEENGRLYFFFDLDFNPGDAVAYKLTTAKGMQEGTIELPYCAAVNYPSFDPASDYTITWIIDQAPEAFLVESYSSEDLWESKQLPSNASSYTVPQAAWEGIEDPNVEINVNAINSKTHGESLAVLGWTMGDESGSFVSKLKAR